MVNALRDNFDIDFTLADFGQNTRSSTSKAEAAAYVELKTGKDERSVYGAGIHHRSPLPTLRAGLCTESTVISPADKGGHLCAA